MADIVMRHLAVPDLSGGLRRARRRHGLEETLDPPGGGTCYHLPT
ncbi:hypothetical protein [Burkholderia plantarii]|nr:hypothetical protein [Burkholderia plantarii]